MAKLDSPMHMKPHCSAARRFIGDCAPNGREMGGPLAPLSFMGLLLMYDNFGSGRTRGVRLRIDQVRWVSQREGNFKDFHERHLEQIAWYQHDGLHLPQEILNSLYRRATDERMLRVAYDHLVRHATTSGIENIRDRLGREQCRWELCRGLRDTLRARTYAPADEKLVEIPKASGRGMRTIVVQDPDDRLIQRAILQTIQPVLDPFFDERSFGFRPRRGRELALAVAEQLVTVGARAVVTVDIKNAFASVPLPRLVQVVRKYLPAKELDELIETVLSGSSVPGLRQGGNLSPLLLNLYLHHILDRRWRKELPNIPLLRYADDIMIVSRTLKEARESYDALARMLKGSGMVPKTAKGQSVVRLGAGECAEWLGFRIALKNRAFNLCMAEGAWAQLEDRLALADAEVNSKRYIDSIIAGWIDQLGPCFQSENRPAVMERLLQCTDRMVPDVYVDVRDLNMRWQRSYARWCRLQKSVRSRYQVEA
jgi:Reverse transcriptase (RNA-dependent DNA polymerase)